MAKKYLLYIHHPRFDEEKEKSKLVNALLDRHYGPRQEGHISKSTAMPIGPMSGLEIEESHTTTPEIDELREKLYEPKAKLCPHGFPPAFCRKAKPGKPCK